MSRRVALAALGVALVMAIAAAVLLGRRGAVSEGPFAERIPFPPPAAQAPSPAVSRADFLGADACAECHPAQHAAWARSTHGRAGGTPDESGIIAPFDGTPIRFRNATVTPRITAGGDFVFSVVQQGEPEQTLRVDAVVGGGHMVGGGTQGFLTHHADGTLRFLPWDWSRQGKSWFCNTGSRSGEGWVPITPEMSLEDCGDWPPIRALGDESRFANCQGCHGSQIEIAWDSASRVYATGFTTLAVNCESCHGPGREHVELARSGRIHETVDIGMRPLAVLGKDESLGVCFQCHALKDQLEPGYLPGESLEEHYALKFPILGDRPYHADGRVRTFAYQATHLFSDCYLNGSLTCTDCHDPHAQDYRDVNRQPIPSRFSDDQCTGCHASKAEPVTAHTHHPAESAGSQCVACHMPYLQHPEVGPGVEFGRSDHTIPVPRPAWDAALGIENACSKCHEQESVETLQRQTEAWWGELKPHNPLVTGLVRARDLDDRTAVAELLLQPEQRHPMAQFGALAYLLENHLAPDMPKLEPEILEPLRELAGTGDPDVRALALAGLHLTRGEEPEIRRALIGELGEEGADDSALRKRWAATLGYLGDRYRESERPAEAIAAYGKALEVRPTDPRVHLNLGLAQAAAGRLPAAIESYRRALALDPGQTFALLNLGIALDAIGDPTGAVAAYRRAIELRPHEPLPYFNLGNAFYRRRQPAQAVEYYEQAATLDPSLAPAHFYLARSYILLEDYESALRAVRRGLRFAPDDATGQQMLRDLEQVSAGP